MGGYDPLLTRLVALRVVAEKHARTYLRVVSRMAGLSDPHCVEVYSVLHPEESHLNRPVVVMEYVKGTTLERLGGEMAGVDLVGLVDGALSGLCALHGQGVVHGRPTGSNILVLPSGRSKLAEPGLPLTPDDRRSWTFSPLEQLRGDQPSRPGDIFTFCVTMWVLFYGRNPFPAHTLSDALEGRHYSPAATVPASALRAILLRGLDPRPDERPTAPELASHIRGLNAVERDRALDVGALSARLAHLARLTRRA